VDAVACALKFSAGIGADGVIIAASTKSDSLISDAANMCRKRGRIVLVGVAGLNIKRSEFYEKELSFQVSCSYGPGRYDPIYEEQGQDYPLPFVRWTEQRNFEAVLDMLAQKKLRTDGVVSAVRPLSEAVEAYARLVEGDIITVILEYPDAMDEESRTVTHRADLSVPSAAGEPTVAVIGAGNFTKAMLLPALRRSGAVLDTIVSAQGLSSASAARKFGFRHNSNDVDAVWSNPDIDTVFITTRHGSHGGLILKALDVGKNVFVEKPLTIHEDELEQIINKVEGVERTGDAAPRLMVGYNRRFAPLIALMKKRLAGRTQPMTAIYTANAGYLPVDHWTQDREDGGGRIIGEACHFIDLLACIVGLPITAVSAIEIGSSPGVETTEDKMTIVLEFADGSHGTVHYFANGAKEFPKERVEVFSEGRILQLDNFRKLESYGFGLKRGFGLPKPGDLLKGQDKGHSDGFRAFIESVRSGQPSPITFDAIVNTTKACFAAVRSAKTGERIELS
jgi:predicted dehydrogenase